MADVTSRIAALRALPEALGETWFSSLEERKKEEAEFHDRDHDQAREASDPQLRNRRFYQAATPVSELSSRWLRSVAPGAVVLDFACGNGLQVIEAAQYDAALAVGIDISGVSVANARENAQRKNLAGNTLFLQRDCEKTSLPASSFDAIRCGGMLHHLDLDRAFPELARILRPGGRILCVEALAYNPVIQLYRELTPDLRTDFEKRHILGMKELRLAGRWFKVENVRFHLLCSPLATLLPSGILRRAGLRVSHLIDGVLTRVPLIQLWSWQFTFELVKAD